MKKIFILLSIIVIGIFAFRTSKKIKNSTNKNISTNNYNGVSVIELFTSEGCSSCPSADRLLPQLAKLDSNIFALSFHVDYWNYLGWKDPFSSAVFSERQRQYARNLRLKTIYTPQLVINGKYELVGSNRIAAESKIRRKKEPFVLIKSKG